jgi:hypothetical protein
MIKNQWATKKDKREKIKLEFDATSWQTIVLPEDITPEMIEDLWIDLDSQLVNIEVNGHTIELDSEDWSDSVMLDKIYVVDKETNGEKCRRVFSLFTERDEKWQIMQ